MKLLFALLILGAHAHGMNQTEVPALQLIEPWGSPFLADGNSCQRIASRLPMRCDELRQEGSSVATFICDSLYERFGEQSLDIIIIHLECDPANGDIQYKFE